MLNAFGNPPLCTLVFHLCTFMTFMMGVHGSRIRGWSHSGETLLLSFVSDMATANLKMIKWLQQSLPPNTLLCHHFCLGFLVAVFLSTACHVKFALLACSYLACLACCYLTFAKAWKPPHSFSYLERLFNQQSVHILVSIQGQRYDGVRTLLQHLASLGLRGSVRQTFFIRGTPSLTWCCIVQITLSRLLALSMESHLARYIVQVRLS